MASYILFDTETTGTQESDVIIQIGALIMHGKNEVESYDELCSTQQSISLEAMEIHNITPEMIAGKPALKELQVWKRINELNSIDNYLIAHNISFDLGMLEKEGFENQYSLIDTLRCAKHLLPDSQYHRLQYLRYSLALYHQEPQETTDLNITIKAHDALSDVVVMKLLLSHLVKLTKESYPDENPMHKLVDLTKRPVMIKKFRFGKYKDQEIKHIVQTDKGYINWMMNNLELDDDLEHTLKFHLADI